jgi:hypothetical protein
MGWEGGWQTFPHDWQLFVSGIALGFVVHGIMDEIMLWLKNRKVSGQ